MRTIKFRAWDRRKNKLVYLEQEKFERMSSSGWYYANLEELIHDCIPLMQFTGLHDKNGKEIYEGDIVKIFDDLIEEIKWVDESNWMGDKCPVNGWVNHQSIYKKPVEVIGNIYQDSHLLEDKV